MSIPEWHETNYDPKDTVSMSEILALSDGYIKQSALRSYATRRRTHCILGPMPLPVCRVSNRKLWLRYDVEAWLAIHVPANLRSARRLSRG